MYGTSIVSCTEALNYQQKESFCDKMPNQFISTWVTWFPEPYMRQPKTHVWTYSSKLWKPTLKHRITSIYEEIPVTGVKSIMCKLINMSMKRKFLGFLYYTWGWEFGCWSQVQQIRCGCLSISYKIGQSIILIAYKSLGRLAMSSSHQVLHSGSPP